MPRWRSKSLRIRSGSPRAVTSPISASMRQRIEANVVSSSHRCGIVVVDVLLVVVVGRLVVEVEELVVVLELVGGMEVVGTAVDEVVVDDEGEVVDGAVVDDEVAVGGVLVCEVEGGVSHGQSGGGVQRRGSVARNVAPAG